MGRSVTGNETSSKSIAISVSRLGHHSGARAARQAERLPRRPPRTRLHQSSVQGASPGPRLASQPRRSRALTSLGARSSSRGLPLLASRPTQLLLRVQRRRRPSPAKDHTAMQHQAAEPPAWQSSCKLYQRAVNPSGWMHLCRWPAHAGGSQPSPVLRVSSAVPCFHAELCTERASLARPWPRQAGYI